MNAKLTFKINNPTGRYRSFDHATCDVKLDGRIVGTIMPVGSGYGLQLHVKVPTIGTCSFEYITLKARFYGSERAAIIKAKEWIRQNIGSIASRYPLHRLEN